VGHRVYFRTAKTFPTKQPWLPFLWENGFVKTTVEIPDALFRQAKAAAAHQGVSLKEFFTDAVKLKLRIRSDSAKDSPPWMKAFGGLHELHRENRRIGKIIEEEFENVDSEDWK
jgi:hypothetical protein